MNKASLFKNHTLILTVFIFILYVLFGLIPVEIAQADAAPPPDPTVGGIGPYRPQKTNVQMMSETVFIDVPLSPSNPEEPRQIRVNASFTMRNQSQTQEQMQVIFPLSRLGYDNNQEQSIYLVDLSSFVAKVNGKPVPITQLTTPPEVPADIDNMEHGYTQEVLWAAFDVTFPANQNVLLQVEYEMLNDLGVFGAEFTGIEYILETGAGWYGNILSANIIVRLPYLVEEEALRYAKPGYVISGRELHWTLKDFEPARKDNLYIGVVQADSWQEVLDLRSAVKRNPNDVDSWVKLASWYTRLSISYATGPNGFPYHLNHRISDQAVEARRKVVDLRPEWGEAHFWLAEILWYTNPKVEAIWSLSSNTMDSIQPDDPSIQEVLHELDLAWSYGLSEDIRWEVEKFVKMINLTAPGLELTLPVTVTATIAPPTETLAPTATNTVSPTTSPTASPTYTLQPTVSPTPIPTKTSSTTLYTLLSLAIGLALMVGAFIYQRKSKTSRMK